MESEVKNGTECQMLGFRGRKIKSMMTPSLRP